MQKFNEIPRGQLSTIILTTLLNEDKYGYEIISEITEKTNGKVVIKQPSLYSSLRRMEEQSLISSYWRDSDIGGKRHYYSITDLGKKYVEKWQANTSYDVNFTVPQESQATELKNENTNLNKPVFLEQSSLLEPVKTIAETDTNLTPQEKLKKDTAFVQYNLFNNDQFIAKPSVELFEKVIPQVVKSPIINEQLLNNEIDNIKPTDDSLEKENISLESLAPHIHEKNEKENLSITTIIKEELNLKQELMLLKKKQKSFTDNIKSNIKLILNDDEQVENINKDNLSNLQNENTTKNIDDSNKINDSNTVQNEIEQSNIDVNLLENLPESTLPTIFQSTKKFLNASDKINDSNTVQDKTEQANTLYIDKISEESENNPLHNNADISVDMKQKKHDDAVYITDKKDLSMFPKVHRIEPARFDHLHIKKPENSNSRISGLYNTQQTFEPKIEEQTPNDTYDTYDTLKNYYLSYGITFGAYCKQQNLSKSRKYTKLNVNKFKVLSYAALLLLVTLQSVLFYLLFKNNQPTFNFLYLLPSISCLALLGLSLVFKNFNTNTQFNTLYKLLYTALFILILFSVNMIGGMTFENIMQFKTTFVFASIISLNYPLFDLIKYLMLKIK